VCFIAWAGAPKLGNRTSRSKVIENNTAEQAIRRLPYRKNRGNAWAKGELRERSVSRAYGKGSVATHHPTFPVKQPIDLLAIGRDYDLQYRLYIGQAKWPTGQLVKPQAVIYLMHAYKVTLISVYADDLQGSLGDLLGGLIGYRQPRYLLCGNLVGDIKDHDELGSTSVTSELTSSSTSCWPVGRPFI
jgi:hypothetical protein